MVNPVIVVVAYNRADSLKTLLDSLNNISTEEKLKLIISIDNGGTKEVNYVAENFKWLHGDVEVIIHSERLGLKNHFIWAGDLTKLYENVLFLEDDLYVSPYVLDFCKQAIEKYADDDRIAGVSLYCPELCEFDKRKFKIINDGYDNFFFQHPYWGNVWSRNKWNQFRTWLCNYAYDESILPCTIRSWGDKSFKKIYIQYLIETNRFVVYPRVSLVTNMGETGVHCFDLLKQYQTIIQTSKKEKYILSEFDCSISKYDAFFEIYDSSIKRMNSMLNPYEFNVDLRCNRDFYDKQYVLTKTRFSRAPILKFSDKMQPAESNILFDIAGDGICLSKICDIEKEEKYNLQLLSEDILDYNYRIQFSDICHCFIYAIKLRLRSSRLSFLFRR